MHALIGVLTALIAFTPSGATADAAVHLIMVEQDGCRYCIEWDREIAPKYPASAEGRFAPLRRMKRADPQLRAFKPVIYTPTFLVVKDGEEVGRVTGYAGQLFFWEELDEQLAKAGFKADWSIPEPKKDSGLRGNGLHDTGLATGRNLALWSARHGGH
jgi:hypothetical protein